MTEESLIEKLSKPSPETTGMMKSLKGDIIILGVGGKIGVSLAMTAIRAIRESGVKKKVIGVSRFSDESARRQLEEYGIETIACDLSDYASVAKLPDVENVIFMAGRKFGTSDKKGLTWVMNVNVPGIVAERYKNSRIVAFSTGCVYPLISVKEEGSAEDDPVDPVGEYAQSCLGRERVFEHYSETFGTKVCLFRLNYAIDLRYGVLFDIASSVYNDEPVDITVGYFNCIWQGDVNNRALLCLDQCTAPANILNVTGPEIVSTKEVAERFGKLFGKDVKFTGEKGDLNYLSDPSKSIGLFGYPKITLETMLEWTAEWIEEGGYSLGKPTHYEVNDGKY